MANPKFRSGIKRAEEAAKASRGRFSRATFFSLDDEESAILRFLTEEHPRCGHVIDEDGNLCREPLYLSAVTDDNECHKHGADVGEPILGWITVDMHTNVKTREEPEGYDGNWPKSLPAVCRYDRAFGGAFPDCYICDHMTNPRAKGKNKKYRPQPRMWALACEREEVREGGKVVAMRDKMRTVKRITDGKEEEVEEQAIVLLNFGWRNFFSHLRGTVEHYGTALDRDYKVTRRGEELDTEYDFVAYDPVDETVEFEDGSKGQERFDLRDIYFEGFYDTDVVLTDEIERRAGDEFYAMFFDERVDQPWEKGEGGNSKSGKSNRPKADKKDREADPDRMKALAARVRGYDENEDPDAEQTEDDNEDEEEQTEDEQTTEAEPEPTPAKASGATKKVAPRKATAPVAKATAKKASSSNGGKPAAKKAPAKKAAARR